MNSTIYILVIVSMAGIGLIITGFIILQVRNQNRLLQKQKELAAAEIAHQKDLLHAVITSQEAERQRIGNDLHDEVGTVLSSLRMLIEKHHLHHSSTGDEVFTLQSKGMIDGVISNVRQIAHNLSPQLSGGQDFYDALHELSDAVNASGTILLSLNFMEDDIPPDLDPGIAMALYRVLTELVNNTIRHAGAKNITLAIQTERPTMQVSYADDGIGFTYDSNPAPKGMGWRNIESRLNMIHADWKMQGKKEKGFILHISVPLN